MVQAAELGPDPDLVGLSDGDVDADIPIPQHVRASIYHELSDSLAVLANVGWDDWSGGPSRVKNGGGGEMAVLKPVLEIAP